MDEIKKIITIETDQAVNSLGKIEGSVQDINKEFQNLDKTSVTLKDIAKDEKDLGDIIRTNTQDIKDNSGEFTRGLNDVGKALDMVIPGTGKLTRGIGDITKAFKALDKLFVGGKMSWVAILSVAVSAVAAMAAYWKDIAKWIGISKDKTKELNRETSYYAASLGITTDISALERQQEALEGLLNIADGKGRLTKAEGTAIGRFVEDLRLAGGTVEGVIKNRKDLEQFKNQLIAVIARIAELRKALATTETTTTSTTVTSATTTTTTTTDTADTSEADAILKRLRDSKKTELELLAEEQEAELETLTETYKKEREILIAAGYDTTELDQEFIEKRKQLLIDQERWVVKITEETNDQVLVSEDLVLTKRQERYLKFQKFLEKFNEENLENVKAYSQDIGNLFGSVADAEEEIIQARINNGKISEEQAEKEFKTVKGFRIAEASMTMLQGIVEAMSTAMTLGPVAGPIVGALNAATVGAAGIAQITRIKNTTFGSGATSAATLPTTSAINTAYTSTQGSSLTDRTNVDTLNNLSNQIRDTRVYVVESDIRQAGKRADVINQETTF